MEENNNSGPKIYFITALIIYLAACVFLQWHLRYEGLNANTIGYLTVAMEYARGNFANAVNGFWPPLISWLTAPLIKAGVTPLFAARIINIIAGFFVLTGVRALSMRFNISHGLRNIILFAMVPVTLSYTTIVFPDLLILLFLIYYLYVVFDSGYSGKVSGGVLAGIFGALAYLGKHYALPFFISHFFMMNVFHYMGAQAGEQKRNVIRNAVLGFLLFSVISGSWIALMSSKYGYFTIGTAGEYNVAKLGPGMYPEPVFGEPKDGDPVYYAGLLKPPYPTALSVWDDPSYVSEKYFTRSNAGAWRTIVFYAKFVVGNSGKVLLMFIRSFSIFSIPILIVYLLFCIRPLKELFSRSEHLFPLFTIMLFSGGYTTAIVSDDTVRYFWLDITLLMLMCGHILTVLFRSEFFNAKARQNVLLIILVGSFLVVPFKDIVNKPSRGENNYIRSDEIERQYNIKGNIASNDRWGDTLQLTYYLNMDKVKTDDRVYYYGMPKKNQSDAEILNELKSYDIKYYIVWNGRSFLPGYQDITKGSIPENSA